MKRKYVIGVSPLTKAQEETFVSYLRDAKVAWWHWIKGMWLVSDRRGSLSASVIRDKLREISNGTRCMVMEVTDKTPWAGAGPKVGDKNMFKWMRETWNAEDDDSGDGR